MPEDEGMVIVGIIGKVSRWLNYVGVTILAFMMLLTVSDVLRRFLFNKPIDGTVELTEYMMVPVVFLGLSWCAVQRENIRVDIFVIRLSPRWQLFLDSISVVISLVIMVLITWQNLLETFSVYDIKQATDILHVPAYPFFIMLTLGCFLLCCVLIIHLLENIVKGIRQ